MTDTTYTIETLTARATALFGNDHHAQLIGQLPDFIRLMSAKLCEDLLDSAERNCTELVFWNFWTIRWKNNAQANQNFLEMDAELTRPFSTRKLNIRFNESGGVVTPDMMQYFIRLISTPPLYLPSLQGMTRIAQDPDGDAYHKDLTIGSNLGYLLRVLFSTILAVTFEEKATVELTGLGSFQLTYKNKPRQGVMPQNGVLQFTPSPAA